MSCPFHQRLGKPSERGDSLEFSTDDDASSGLSARLPGGYPSAAPRREWPSSVLSVGMTSSSPNGTIHLKPKAGTSSPPKISCQPGICQRGLANAVRANTVLKMPRLIPSDDGETQRPCVRCHTQTGTLFVRGDHLCNECFQKYIFTKVLKRAELGKIRSGFHEAQKRVLIPCPFDASSLSLLYLMHELLNRRDQRGQHAGFTVKVLCIDESTINGPGVSNDQVASIRRLFPHHSYDVVTLESLLSFGIDLPSLSGSETNLLALENEGSAAHLQKFLASLRSASSKMDCVNILRRRLIALYALNERCDSILFSDSATRLAERVLSETAKGRGVSLPWLIGDGILTEGIPCFYPMRELLQNELVLYADIAIPSFTSLLGASMEFPKAVSSKDTTIDVLMNHYFSSVEQNYPSIVTNVIKTSNKLMTDSAIGREARCAFCQMPQFKEENEKQEASESTPSDQHHKLAAYSEFCLGCKRMLLGA